MLNLLIVVVAGILLAALLWCEKEGKTNSILAIKTPLSCLFIVVALFQPHPMVRYYYSLLVGLLFCLGGDVCLALPHRRAFLLGLVSFLVGHVFFIVAFLHWSKIDLWIGVGSIIVFVVSARIYLWLKPHLGTMKVPVLLYVVVISLMLCGAWSILGDSKLPLSGRIVIFAGALSFYISDLFVARDRFLGLEFVNRLMGLPLYYVGQFLLAFSVGMLA